MRRKPQISDLVMVVAAISWIVEAQHMSNTDFRISSTSGENKENLFKVISNFFFLTFYITFLNVQLKSERLETKLVTCSFNEKIMQNPISFIRKFLNVGTIF